jgi:apolipoprotein N-acyltransferase
MPESSATGESRAADPAAAAVAIEPAHLYRRPGSWVWLAPAAALLPFANGANSIALAAWLAPLCLLRFVRAQKPGRGLATAYLVLILAFAFQFRGMVPIPGFGLLIFLVVNGIPQVLPYVVDRLVARRLPGSAAVLVFPLAWTATEFFYGFGPYGSWGAIGYSQFGSLPLLQLLSVTGLGGVTFLIGWFAAASNHLWEQGLAAPGARRAVLLWAATVLAVVLCGGARMTFFAPAQPTVRVASLSRRVVEPQASASARQHLMQNRASDAELDEIRAAATAVHDDLLERAEREALAGAKIIFWGEANAAVFKEDEPQLIQRGRDLAAKHGVYLGMGLAAWRRNQTPPLENKFVLIEPSGSVAWEFFKARPVPGGEAATSVTRDGRLPRLDTPHGRLSAVICFDADFPRLLAQAGAMEADLLLDPSNDWRAIDPWHTQMASFRAIEQGVNLIRQTSGGLSAAYDYQGRQLAAMDHYNTADYALISQVPTGGVRTIYSRFGDWLGWLCAVGTIGLAGMAIARKRT